MNTPESYAWAAGLFEGEGCLTWNKKPNGTKYPHASLSSTDEDVVIRFAHIMECGSVTGPLLRENRKPKWSWRAVGIDAIYRIEDTIGPYLGERRTEKLQELLTYKRKRNADGTWIDRREFSEAGMESLRAAGSVAARRLNGLT